MKTGRDLRNTTTTADLVGVLSFSCLFVDDGRWCGRRGISTTARRLRISLKGHRRVARLISAPAAVTFRAPSDLTFHTGTCQRCTGTTANYFSVSLVMQKKKKKKKEKITKFYEGGNIIVIFFFKGKERHLPKQIEKVKAVDRLQRIGTHRKSTYQKENIRL